MMMVMTVDLPHMDFNPALHYSRFRNCSGKFCNLVQFQVRLLPDVEGNVSATFQISSSGKIVELSASNTLELACSRGDALEAILNVKTNVCNFWRGG